MTPEEFKQLRDQVASLINLVTSVFKIDRYLFQKDLELSKGTKIKGFIYCGSSSQPPPGWTVTLGVGGAAGQNTVTHNLGTTKYTATATAVGSTNDTFAVGVANENATSFNVYTSIPGGGLVGTAFNFIVVLT